MTTDETRDYLAKIPAIKQRQDSVLEQLADLRLVANKLGMYDAADAISQLFETKGLESLLYGCHCDLDPGMEPDECVIESGDLNNCIHAKKGMRKEQCEYWRIIANR